jgi:HSP20 family protein
MPQLGLQRGGDGWIRALDAARGSRRRPVADASPIAIRPAAFSTDRGFPKIELLQSPSMLLVRAAVPGVRSEDLIVRIEDSDLVIEGELRPIGDEAGCRTLVGEWSYGPFHRRVQLGSPVDPARMRSELRDGLLRVEIDLRTD